MKLFIGVDIGTTGIRAGVYDEEFTLLGQGSGKSVIRKGPNNEIIQEAEEIFLETASAVKKAIHSSKADGRNIACISFDGQMAGIMGIDKNWSAVTPYDSWLDTRCSEQVARMQSKAKDLVIEKTGNIPSYNHGPKILWWKEQQPETFKRIHSFIQPAAYVAGRLCKLSGKDAFVDWSYLHFSGFADTGSLGWDTELTSLFQIPIEKLPKIVSPFSIVGTVSRENAGLFNVPEDCPVAAGCGDTVSCFLGTGAVDKGMAVDVAGTASAFALAVDRFVSDHEGLVYTGRSVLKDIWYSMSYINGGGLNLEWFKAAFAKDKTFDRLDSEAKRIQAGSNGLIFIPHLEGRGYPHNSAVRGQWKGFTRDHTGGHFYRSILEGIVYEYALYKEKILKLMGSSMPYTVRGVAGGSKSDVWNQIKADILNCNYCTINREDISILGQALIAASAEGHIRDISGTVGKIVNIDKVFYPDEKNHAVYQKRIEEYKSMLGQYGK